MSCGDLAKASRAGQLEHLAAWTIVAGLLLMLALA
jgi:hypothetical protein